jgi:hypothetical protein
MPAPTSKTATGEAEWCVLRAEGMAYTLIARQYGVDESTVRAALQKPANRARIARITSELEEAAISAARHNVAASVGEKCRLRLSLARNLGIREGDTPSVGIDSSATIRDYLSVDKALLDQLDSYSKRAREANGDERLQERHDWDMKLLKEMRQVEQAINSAETPTESEAEAILPANGRESL